MTSSVQPDVLRRCSPRRPDPPGAAHLRILRLLAAAWRNAPTRHWPPCPHCHNPRTIRWGTFSGRQRFRCHGCGRTFSSFTGTPFWHGRKPHMWLDFAVSLSRGESIREAARSCSIAPSTAFRWRHALLARPPGPADEGGCAPRAVARLGGVVGLDELRVPESFKGRTPPSRPARSRARAWGRRFIKGRRHWILFLGCCSLPRARSTRCRIVSVGVRQSSPRWFHYREIADRHLQPQVRIAASRSIRWSRLERISTFAEREREQFTEAGRVARETARLAREGLRNWMPRFRGVATRYMEHYIRWYISWFNSIHAEAPEWPAGQWERFEPTFGAEAWRDRGMAFALSLAAEEDLFVPRQVVPDSPPWMRQRVPGAFQS
jgi:transposase-like protein